MQGGKVKRVGTALASALWWPIKGVSIVLELLHDLFIWAAATLAKAVGVLDRQERKEMLAEECKILFQPKAANYLTPGWRKLDLHERLQEGDMFVGLLGEICLQKGKRIRVEAYGRPINLLFYQERVSKFISRTGVAPYRKVGVASQYSHSLCIPRSQVDFHEPPRGLHPHHSRLLPLP